MGGEVHDIQPKPAVCIENLQIAYYLLDGASLIHGVALRPRVELDGSASITIKWEATITEMEKGIGSLVSHVAVPKQNTGFNNFDLHSIDWGSN